MIYRDATLHFRYDVTISVLGCEPGYYGNMCHQCGHCVEGDVCSEATGNCPRGCIVGWKGDMCLQRKVLEIDHIFTRSLCGAVVISLTL